MEYLVKKFVINLEIFIFFNIIYYKIQIELFKFKTHK